MFTVTEEAIRELKQLLEQQGAPGDGVRVRIQGFG